MKKGLLILAMCMTVAAVPVAAEGGPLDLGAVSNWFYGQVKKRGVMATLWNLKGEKTFAGAINVGMLHNKAKTRTWAAIAVGGEVTIERKPKSRFLLATPINFADIIGNITESRRLKPYVTFLKLPKDLQVWGGPFVRSPQKEFKEWTWKSHTGGYIALGKKFDFAGEAKAKAEAEEDR